MPLLTWAVVTVAVPAALRNTVAFLQVATGATLSCTVTLALQEAVLPLTSVTVSTTVLTPVLAQVKVEGETVKTPIPQLSVLPLFICAAVTVAVPLAPNCTVAG